MQDRLPPNRRTSCNARPDHTSGSKCEELSVSKSRPFRPTKRTSMKECRHFMAQRGPSGPDRTLIAGSQAAVSTRIIGAVVAIVADRLAPERRCADDDERQVVGRLRRPQLVAHPLQNLARVR